MANKTSPSPRCTYRAENLIAMQRQTLANSIHSKQQARSKNKVLATVPSRGRIITRSLSYNYKKHQPSSVVKPPKPGLLFVGFDDGPMLSVRDKTEEEKKNTPLSSTKKQRPGLQRSSNHASNTTLQTASSRTLQTASSRTLQTTSSRTLQTTATTSTRTLMEDEHSISTQSTATMAQSDMTPPLHIPGVFRPAVGCIQATDFLIRCFIARLRSGIMVYKHNRSRFTKCPRPCRLFLDYSKDRQTMLVCKPTTKKEDTADADGAGAGYQTKRLNLLECREVRLALSADSSSPRFTGTAVLRQKCDATDAHKSFSLVFGHRTLDISAMTQDQCRMLTEGFSALCYRLHAKKQAAEEERKEQFAAYRDPIIVNDDKANETRSCLRRRRPSI